MLKAVTFSYGAPNKCLVPPCIRHPNGLNSTFGKYITNVKKDISLYLHMMETAQSPQHSSYSTAGTLLKYCPSNFKVVQKSSFVP